MKPLCKHILWGFAAGFFGMPIWTLLWDMAGMDALTIPPSNLMLKMLIGGGLGILVFLSVFDFPRWAKRFRNKAAPTVGE